MRAHACRAAPARPASSAALPEYRRPGPVPSRGAPTVAPSPAEPAEDAKLARGRPPRSRRQLHHASAVERERAADDELVQTRPREPQRVGPGVERHLDERGRGQDGHALDPVIGKIRGRLAVEPGLVRGLCGGEAAGEQRVATPGRGRDLAGREA